MKLLPNLALFALIVSACSSPKGEGTFANLNSQFQNPPKEYRSAPLWVWNTEIKANEIDLSLEGLKANGFGGVFVHPRPGLITEYLSDDWHKMYVHTVEKSKELGMDVWIYDENSYPSGFGGGNVPEQMPESYNQGGGLIPTKVEKLPSDTKDYFTIVVKEGNTTKDITNSTESYKNKKGEYYLYKKSHYGASAWTADHSYVDLLAKGVAEKFMEITMSGYEKHLGAEFGINVKGVFTDEPEIPSPGGLRWTPDLFSEFEKDYGYSLSDNLPSLHDEVGDYEQVRHDYFELLLKLFVDRWAKPWYNYCEAKNLNWTGHYWEHSWPYTHGGPDNMAMAAYQQMPGIDMLFNTFNEEHPHAQFGNVRSVKEVSSIANQLGRHRVLSETYGGAGWSITFKEMKRYADWQFVLGVNFVNQHIAPLSIAGLRKQDYPPMFNPAAPWWNYYRELNDYNGRMSLATSTGEQLNDILVLEPTTTLWLTNKTFNDIITKEGMQTGIEFQKLITAMTKNLIEYDLGCEDVIKNHGSSAEGKFVVGNRAYSSVIIPPMNRNLEKETFTLLKSFAEAGGKVYAFNTSTHIDGKKDDSIKSFFESTAVTKIDTFSSENLQKLFATSQKIKFSKNQGGNLYHMRRNMKDGELIVLANISLTDKNSVSFTTEGKYATLMDGMTGETFAYPAVTDNGTITVETDLEPAESKMFFISDRKTGASEYIAAPELTNEIKAETKISRVKDNALAVDFLDLTTGGKTTKDMYYFDANIESFKYAGYDSNPWFCAVQYKRRILEKELTNTDGFKASYSFDVDENVNDFSSFKIVVEKGELYDITVNGKPVKASDKFLADPSQKIIDISACVQKGNNTINLNLPKFDHTAEIYTIFVLGDFNVESKNGKWTITAPTEYTAMSLWKDMKAPFYPWEFAYTKTINVEKGNKYIVKADGWRGITAEVRVNNAPVGIIYGDPYTKDISDFISSGENKVEVRVVGSLDNLIGPHHQKPEGIVGPWSWSGTKTHTAPEKYYFSEYGMIKDFNIYVDKSN